MTTDVNADSSTKKRTGPKKYGYDASAYNASPITRLDSFLAEILPSMPVTLMPGESDPANFSLPQQGIHRAMFPQARAYCAPPPAGDNKQEPSWFDSVTNPWEGDVEGWRLWGSSGQNVDDILRYLNFADEEGNVADGAGDIEARMRVMEAMLRWRCGVPTAPDTLCKLLFGLLILLVQMLISGNRVLSISNARSIRYTNLPTHLLCRQPATIQDSCD